MYEENLLAVDYENSATNYTVQSIYPSSELRLPMSGTPSPNDGEQINDRFQLIVDFEKEILATEDLIDICLNENLVKADRDVRRNLVLSDLESVLRTEVDENAETHDERVYRLAQSIMSSLSMNSAFVRRAIQGKGGSKELVQLLTKLSSKYGAESTRPNRISQQGPNYWSDLHMELVKRPPSGSVGMNYRIVIGHDEEKEISADINSNLVLCMRLLNAHIRAVDEFGEDALEQMNTTWLNDLEEQLNRTRAQIEAHKNQDDSSENDN